MTGTNDSMSRNAIYALIILSALLVASMIPARGLPSTSNTSSVYLELWAGSDNWTTASGSEPFVLMISNTNSTLSIKEVNITLSKVGGNAAFAVSGQAATGWACYNITTDGTGNVTHMTCNTSTANITSGTSLNITFTAQAMSLSSEAVYDWEVTVLNASTAVSLSQNITSGIDLAPRFSDAGANATLLSENETIGMWYNVTDSTLNVSTANITLVNASTLAFVSDPNETCTALGSSSWNCSANYSLSSLSDGNYSFNISASDNESNTNHTTYPGSFFYDTASPTVSLTTPADEDWNTNSDELDFNFTPSDTSLLLSNCSLYITNSTMQDFGYSGNSTTSLTSGTETNITVPGGLPEGNYSWAVMCEDSVGNSAFSSNRTLHIGNISNLIVASIDIPLDPTPYPNQQNLVINVTVENNGTANATANTLLWVRFSNDASCSSLIDELNHTIDYENLSAGGQASTNFTVDVGYAGTYYVCAGADYNEAQAEQYEDDNSLTESFSTNLTVNITAIDDSSLTTPGGDIEVTVNVTYFNGTAVTGLEEDNFTIRDTWGYNYERDEGEWLTNISSFNEDSAGNYTFDYTVPDVMYYEDDHDEFTTMYAESGVHYLEVMANVTENDNTGKSPASTSSYTLHLPFLEVDENLDNTLDFGEQSDKGGITYSNDGDVNVTSITLQEPECEDDDIISFNDWDDPSNVPDGLDLGPHESYEVEFDDGNDFYYEAVGNGTCTLLINASYENGSQTYWYTKVVEIEVDSGNDDDGGGTSSTSTTTDDGIECTTNSSCDSDEWCKRLECVRLYCPDGYSPVSHKCRLDAIYDVDITSYESALSVVQGESISTNVTVENTGNSDLTASLEVELDVDGVVINVTPASASIDVNGSKTYTVTFTTSGNSTVGKHTGSFEAGSSFSTAKDTKSFTFTIQPLAGAIDQIKKDYENYTIIVNQLMSTFESAKSQLTEGNLTALGSKVNETMDIFKLLEQAMNDEDYALAATYLAQLKGAVSSTETLMEELGIDLMPQWNPLVVWALAAFVCIGAVGLLIYMMVPPQGYTLGKGYSPQGKGVMLDRLRNAIQSVRGAMPGGKKPTSATSITKRYKLSYSGSYKKLDNAYKSQPTGGIGSKLKNVLKKK